MKRSSRKKSKKLSRQGWLQKQRGQPGGRPGQAVVDPNAPQSTISVIAYDTDRIIEQEDCSVDDLSDFLADYRVTWVNIEGLGTRQVLEDVAGLFSIHPLALEDVVNVPQRVKIEDYGDQLFVILQLLSWQSSVCLEQLSLFLGHNFVLTFQERAGDPFGLVRQRLRTAARLRNSGPDYLFYALTDATIDHYFPVLERLREHLEELESALREVQPDALQRIQQARTELSEARRAVGPLREVTRSLLGGEWPHLTEATRVYLRDCRDHVHEASEIVESCRDVTAGLMDIHLSTVSHQANRTMQLLTVISTIFMPLSFMVGLYGMNFDTEASRWNMPELASPWGYPILLGLMVTIALGLVTVFWKKGWFD